MVRKIEDIKNFGPYMVKILQQIGIFTEEDLMQTDYVTIQKKLVAQKINPNILIFYSIEMGLQNRKWNDITPTEKEELKKILGRK